MEDKFKDKFRVPSARLTNWDYGSHGLYSVTICTNNRIHHLGEIISTELDDAVLKPSEIGAIAETNWQNIPGHFPFVELDEYVIMPNHIHGILFLNKPAKIDWQPNKFGPQRQNLGSVMRGFKASVKTYATINGIDFEWQPRFHDHIIRSEKEYTNIRNYIANNPQQWLLNGDKEDNFLS
ncbi:transposase [Mucilaginibacter sp.]|uniref:transposase n=1 Tax=Mucilaginibacter sp. TaxID=1882438 RepID=UPI003265A7F2